MLESETRARSKLQEVVKKGSISAFNYAFCRLILDKLLELDTSNIFTDHAKESVGKGHLGLKPRPYLKPLAEILLKQLSVQMRLEIDFDSPQKVSNFIDAARIFLSIFEESPLVTM